LAPAAAGGLLLAGLAWLGWPRAVEMAIGSSLLGGTQGRLEVWQRAVFIIQDYPLTGVGLGGFGPVVDLLYPFRTLAPGSVPHAHNLFLQIAVDLGLPGLAAWLACWAPTLLLAGQMFRAAQPGRAAPAELDLARGLAAGLLVSNLALGLHGLTDAVVWGMVRPAPLVWALWGLCAAGWVAWRSPARKPA
jgi:putative inorganic carbon (HCO3(-)) transporter